MSKKTGKKRTKLNQYDQYYTKEDVEKLLREEGGQSPPLGTPKKKLKVVDDVKIVKLVTEDDKDVEDQE